MAVLGEAVELDKDIVVADDTAAAAAAERLQVNPGVLPGAALLEEGKSGSTVAAVDMAPDIRESCDTAESAAAGVVGTQQAVAVVADLSQLASLLSPHRTET